MTDTTPAILFEQGDRPLLLFSLPASDLLALSYFNTREIDRQSGVQRGFASARSRQIADFIAEPDSCLANNIIVNLELASIGLSLADAYHSDTRSLDLRVIRECAGRDTSRPEPVRGKCAFVVDGQHRLRAFDYSERKDFPLAITALVDLSLAEVAELFVQINYNQKPVNKSLVFDLLGLSPDMFPGCRELHDVVERLNEDPESPLYRRIKMLGVGEGTVSQASLITAIEKYRVRERLGDILGATLTPSNLYDIIWNFFTGVSTAYETLWDERGRLCRTIATRALILVMVEVVKSYHDRGRAFTADHVAEDMGSVDISGILERALAFGGERGVTELAKLILRSLGLIHE